MYNLQKIKALTIVETLITLLAMSFMIAGPIFFISRSFSYSHYLQKKTIANSLAQEGLELVTSWRNNSTTTFSSTVDSVCLNSSCAVDWNGSSDIPTLRSCSQENESCRLYLYSENGIQMFRHGIGTEASPYLRSLNISKSGNAYIIESRVWSEEDPIFKIDVKLKKIIYAL